MKIMTIVELPDELGQEWLQHMRDFDVAHGGCKFEIYASSPDKSKEEIMEILDVKPPFALKKVVE